MLCFGLLTACGDAEPTPLTIDDITIVYREEAEIVPTSTPGGDITYDYVGSGIRIEGNTVTGLKGNTSTEVTATASNGATASFTVNVVYENPFGKNVHTQSGGGVFAPVDEITFTKTAAEYGEDYYYVDGEALAGAKYLLTGRLDLGEQNVTPDEGAYAAIVLKESEEKTVRLRFQYAGGKYDLYSEYAAADGYTGAQKVFSVGDNGFGFAVMVKDGGAYFFCNQSYIGKVDKELTDVHVGFGGANAAVTVSRLRSYTDDSRMEEYVALTQVTFGAHAYGGANSDKVFVETQTPGEYQKTKQSYGQSFYYQDGIPVAGNSYSIKFTIKLTNPASTGLVQSTFLIAKDDMNMVRFALEYNNAKKQWYFFTDKKIEGTFGAWVDLGTISGDTATLKIVYNENDCSLYNCFDNGETEVLVKTVTLTKAQTLGYTHFGFGGEGCTITLGDITADRVI